MARDRSSKEVVTSAESVNSSEDETESEYTVERVVDKRITKGKVSWYHSNNNNNKKITQKSPN